MATGESSSLLVTAVWGTVPTALSATPSPIYTLQGTLITLLVPQRESRWNCVLVCCWDLRLTSPLGKGFSKR